MKRLPIENILSELKQSLHHSRNNVLVAPPGAGKTTRIPLALLTEPWLAGQRIIMLEPRRIAARAAARYMAALLGERVGETVGYRVRMETCIGPQTIIEVITEGVLTRILQNDPGLENVGIIIFDEFHERSMHADLGLALCLQSQAVLREDLRILVMSATLDAASVASLLGDAPILISDGISFPVKTHYLARPIEGRMELAIVRKLEAVIAAIPGDILVFLPGVKEIHRVESQLLGLGIGKDIIIAKLYGTLSPAAQDLAILPESSGKRKIVLTTSIAETSITVEGVRIVIDSGLMRRPRFSPRIGMTHLETVKVSRGASDQRRGRAGRLESGVCFRMWTYEEELAHTERDAPEIMEADLTQLALELAVWGAQDPTDLLWLNTPPKAALNQAKELLCQLGALSPEGHITKHGQKMAVISLHPRLSHMIFKGKSLGYGNLACEVAVMLDRRDIFQGSRGLPDADIRLRIEFLRLHKIKRTDENISAASLDAASMQRIWAEIRYLKKTFSIFDEDIDDLDACGLLLAFAYPDRIGQGRGDGRFLLRNGHGAAFKESQLLAREPYFVAAELGGDQGREHRIFLGAPIDLKTLRFYFKDQIKRQDVIAWNHETQAVQARQYERLGALILSNHPIEDSDPEKMTAALLQGIAEEGLMILPWTKAACQLHQRLMFMHYNNSDWPDVSDEVLLITLGKWLGPYLYNMSSRDHLQRLNLVTALGSMLTWEQGQKLNVWAPTHILAPSGQRIAIDYSNPAMPVLPVRLQEMFGLKETPSIGQGKTRLTLHLLSPARRPVQVTKDLASFWENTYREVKKDLMGRYPKHYWPDNPLDALPTHRAKPFSKK